MSSTPNAGTSIRPLTGVLQDDPDKVDAIRDSLRCTGVLPSFAVLDGTKKDGTKKLQARSALQLGIFFNQWFFPVCESKGKRRHDKSKIVTHVQV